MTVQRTNEQATKRYFASIWSIFVLMVVAMNVIVLVVKESVPDVAFVFANLVTAIGASAIGFIHGITIFLARQQDAEERERSTSLTAVAEQLPCLIIGCDDPECIYLHDNERDDVSG